MNDLKPVMSSRLIRIAAGPGGCGAREVETRRGRKIGLGTRRHVPRRFSAIKRDHARVTLCDAVLHGEQAGERRGIALCETHPTFPVTFLEAAYIQALARPHRSTWERPLVDLASGLSRRCAAAPCPQPVFPARGGAGAQLPGRNGVDAVDSRRSTATGRRASRSRWRWSSRTARGRPRQPARPGRARPGRAAWRERSSRPPGMDVKILDSEGVAVPAPTP